MLRQAPKTRPKSMRNIVVTKPVTTQEKANNHRRNMCYDLPNMGCFRAQILGRNVTSLFLCIGLLRSKAFAPEDLQAPIERLYRNSRSLGSLDRVTDRRSIPRHTICSFHIGSIARVVQPYQRFHTVSGITPLLAGSARDAAEPWLSTKRSAAGQACFFQIDTRYPPDFPSGRFLTSPVPTAARIQNWRTGHDDRNQQ